MTETVWDVGDEGMREITLPPKTQEEKDRMIVFSIMQSHFADDAFGGGVSRSFIGYGLLIVMKNSYESQMKLVNRDEFRKLMDENEVHLYFIPVVKLTPCTLSITNASNVDS